MAPIGTPLSGGGTSAVGHMWYTLDKGDGSTPLSFGFAPITSGTPLGAGKPDNNDNDNYLNTDPTKPIVTTTPIEITQLEYDRLKAFGQDPANFGFSTFYNGLSNSCVDFVYKAFQVAGLDTPATRTEGCSDNRSSGSCSF